MFLFANVFKECIPRMEFFSTDLADPLPVEEALSRSNFFASSLFLSRGLRNADPWLTTRHALRVSGLLGLFGLVGL